MGEAKILLFAQLNYWMFNDPVIYKL